MLHIPSLIVPAQFALVYLPIENVCSTSLLIPTVSKRILGSERKYFLYPTWPEDTNLLDVQANKSSSSDVYFVAGSSDVGCMTLSVAMGG